MAVNAKVGTFATGTGTDDIVLSGFGFQPKATLFWWNGDTSAVDAVTGQTHTLGIGVGVGTADRRCAATRSVDASAASNGGAIQRADACVCVHNSDAPTIDGLADIKSIDSDGLTLAIDDVFLSNMRVNYLALGGSDITNAATGMFTEAAATGNQDITSLAFQPNFVLFFHNNFVSDPPTVSTNRSRLGVGVATSSAQRFTWSMGGSEGIPDMDIINYGFGGECITCIADTPGTSPVTRYDFVTFLSNGFRLNCLETANNSRRIHFIAIAATNVSCGESLTQTDTTTDIVVSGLGYKPACAMIFSSCQAEHTQDVLAGDGELSIGAATSTSARVAASILDQTGVADSIVTTAIEYDEIYANISTAEAIEGLMDVKSFDAGGVTFIMDDADPAQKWFGWFTIGPAVEGALTPAEANQAQTSDAAPITFYSNEIVPAEANQAQVSDLPYLYSTWKASQGPLYPTTQEQSAVTPYDGIAWVATSVVNIGADDTAYASIVAPQYDTGVISNLLIGRNFGAAIPTESTINGLLLEIGKWYSAGSARDSIVSLWNGSLIGSNLGSTGIGWPSSIATINYGGSANLWGTVPTPAMVNGTNFGFAMAAVASALNTDVWADFYRVTIYHSGTAGSYGVQPAGAWQAQASDAGSISFDSGGQIAVAEGMQAQLVDAATLAAIYVIATDQGNQAQVSDASLLTPIDVIAPSEAAQAQVSDAATLTPIDVIATAEASQAQVSDAAAVTPIYVLTPAESTQAQVSDAAIITAIYVITSAEANQAQVADIIVISQDVYIDTAQANQAQVSDAASLVVTDVIATAEGAQAQVSDIALLTVIDVIAPAEGAQAQVSDAAVISGEINIATAEGNQAQVSDAASLIPIDVIATAQANQAQVSDAAPISEGVYVNYVTSVQPSNLIGYWPLSEDTGTLANDYSSQDNDGLATDVTFGSAGVGDGNTAASFNGTSSYIDLYSTEFVADFNGNEGSFSAWVFMNDWAESNNRQISYFSNSAYSNYIYIRHFNSKVQVIREAGGDGSKLVQSGVLSGSGWKHITCTWSDNADSLQLYIDGISIGTPASGLGTFSGTIASDKCSIGVGDAHIVNFWSGLIAHPAIWDIALTPTEILGLYQQIIPPTIDPARANQAQVSDAASLSLDIVITTAQANQAQVSDAVTITSTYLITPDDNFQAQVSDTASLIVTDIIAPFEGAQAQVSDAASLTPIYVIATVEANQAQFSDAASILFDGPTWVISPTEGAQAQASDPSVLSAIYVMTVSDSWQAQLSDAGIATVYGVVEHGERKLHALKARSDSVFLSRPTHSLPTRADLEVDD